ncbi:ABC transporter ATP-binding protein [Modestobacter lapidis]|nr:ATP-binding cassette domain-containing protein [Modestobacter lapidis]
MLSAERMDAGHQPGVPVVRGLDLTVQPGQVVGLAGPSGSGKTTVARVLGRLLAPLAGSVTVDGYRSPGVRYAVPRASRTAVAMLFQSPRLSVDPRLSLADVVAEPLRVRGTPTAGRRNTAARSRRVAELAEEVGLTGDLLQRRPAEVSDGQLQRACLARALAQQPRYLVCDEMTAMLDASTTAALVGVVRDRVRAGSLGVVAISHDEDLLAVWADSTVHLPAHPPVATTRAAGTAR